MTAQEQKPERASCMTCAHRQRCHGKQPVVTHDTIFQLVRETVVEVLSERGVRVNGASSCAEGGPH